LPNQAARLRLGWTYPNYIGSAALRNKLKRWSREYARKQLSEEIAAQAFDINIFLRRQNEDFYLSLTHEVFDDALKNAFDRFQKYRVGRPSGGRASGY